MIVVDTRAADLVQIGSVSVRIVSVSNEESKLRFGRDPILQKEGKMGSQGRRSHQTTKNRRRLTTWSACL